MQQNSEQVIPPPDARWFDAPAERTPEFHPAYAQVSIALQSALRTLVPAQLLNSADGFRDTFIAYPLLVWKVSRPYRGKSKTELTYDVLNPISMAKFYRLARPELIVLLTQMHAEFAASGDAVLAADYAPRRITRILTLCRAHKKCRNGIAALLVGEGALLNALIPFGGAPHASRARIVAEFQKTWRTRLTRFYASEDFTPLAPALLDAATAALDRFLKTAESLPVADRNQCGVFPGMQGSPDATPAPNDAR
jgi:hypothetical protein